MPDESPVVWPEDPIEADTRAAEAEPEPEATPKPAPAPESSWPATFEEALKESQAAQGAPAPAPATSPAPAAMQVDPSGNEYPTQPAMPAIPAKTSPPAQRAPETTKTVPPAVRSAPSIPAASAGEEPPTGKLKTQPPAPSGPALNGEEPAHVDAEPEPAEARDTEPGEVTPPIEAAPIVAESMAEPVTEAEADEKVSEPVEAAEPEPQPEPAIEGTMIMAPPMPSTRAAEPAEPATAEGPVVQPEPEPSRDENAEPVMAGTPAAAEPAAPAPAPGSAPEPAPQQEEWIPAPVNPPVPSWAPKIGSAPVEEDVAWPGSNLPSWAPIGGGRSTSNMPAASRPAAPKASIPVGEALPQSRPPAPSSTPSHPPAPQSQPAAAAGQSPAGSKPKTTSSWEVVQQKPNEAAKPEWAPSGEDRSYAEWFAWAKRSGAPASACHAAAQGAFRALTAGHDMNTAVQWATLAMASPPGLVGAPRQMYCAWYSLGNIDLKLPSPQAHAFAAGAIKALDGGADAPTAHQAGLAAAGIVGA